MSKEEDVFGHLDKQRDVEIIIPDNKLKQKVGAGGIDPRLIKNAEQVITENKTDFMPIAESYFAMLDASVQKIAYKDIADDAAFEALFYPLVQLKAQGTMFKYPVISEISGMLINFLEVVESLDDDAVSIINAHKVTLRAILNNRIPASHETDKGNALVNALKDACLRYFQSKNK